MEHGESLKISRPCQAGDVVELTGSVMCVQSFVSEGEAKTKSGDARYSENMGESKKSEEQVHGFERDKNHWCSSESKTEKQRSVDDRNAIRCGLLISERGHRVHNGKPDGYESATLPAAN